jgi:hypothetical protein
MYLNLHLKSGAFKGTERSDMLTKVLKGILANRVEPDAVADYCTILGDLNYRFKATYTDHIHNVRKSA